MHYPLDATIRTFADLVRSYSLEFSEAEAQSG
jgi:hypothetical protein